MYRIVKLTGWTPDQIDQAPAELIDWLLEIDITIEEVRAEVARDAAAAAREERDRMLGHMRIKRR